MAHMVPAGWRACQRQRCSAALHACRGQESGFDTPGLGLSCANPQFHSLEGILSNRGFIHRINGEPALLCPGRHLFYS